MIQEARMAVPPEKGAQVNADETLLPGAIEDAASTESFLPASHQGMFMRELDNGAVLEAIKVVLLLRPLD